MGWETRSPRTDHRGPGNGETQLTVQGVERVIEAAQRLVADRYSLLKLELGETARAGARGSIAIGTGVVMGALGSGLLLAAAIALLMLVLPAWAALAVGGGSCLLLGGAFGFWGRAVFKRRLSLRATAREIAGIAPSLASGDSPPAIAAGAPQELQAPPGAAAEDDRPTISG